MKADLSIFILGIYSICLLILSISSMKTLSTSWSQSTPLDTSSRLFNELLIADENLFENCKESFEKNESFENCGEMFCDRSTCPNEDWTTTAGEFFWPINGGFFSAPSWWKVLSFESLLLVFEDVVFIPAVSGCLPSPFVLFSISLQTPPSSPQPCLLTRLFVGNTLPYLPQCQDSYVEPQMKVKGNQGKIPYHIHFGWKSILS